MGQQTVVRPWKLSLDAPEGREVYRPEPILFVHGINDNDAGWQTAISVLQPYLDSYHVSRAVNDFLSGDNTSGRYRATQRAYLHTFNYGDPPGQNTTDQQSFDHIEWNAWESDLHTRTFTNVYLKSTDSNYIHPARPTDQRQTLDRRISAVREAYATDPGDTNTWPNAILIAHSMGGLLSHYYLIKSAPATGVRRLVTLASPHQGSHIANWVIWDQTAGIGARIFDSVSGHFAIDTIKFLSRPTYLGGYITPGYQKYPLNGALEDLTVLRRDDNPKLKHFNDLMDFFWTRPAPKLEYVFNVYILPAVLSKYHAQRISTHDADLSSEQLRGDGVVAQWSAAGKPGNDVPSIWNGWTNVNANIHDS